MCICVCMLFCSCCLLFSVVYFDCYALGMVWLDWTWFGLVRFGCWCNSLIFCSEMVSPFRLERQRVGVCHRDFLIENLMNTCRQLHSLRSHEYSIGNGEMHEYLWISSIEKQNERQQLLFPANWEVMCIFYTIETTLKLTVRGYTHNILNIKWKWLGKKHEKKTST